MGKKFGPGNGNQVEISAQSEKEETPRATYKINRLTSTRQALSGPVGDEPTAPPKLLSYRQAAFQLSVSLNHLRNLIDTGMLSSVDVGPRGRRVRAEDIDMVARHGIGYFSARNNATRKSS